MNYLILLTHNYHRKMKQLLLFTFTVFFSVALCAQETTLLVENFDYNQGEEIRLHGWYPHSNGGTNPILVSNEGLSWTKTAYLGSGIGRAALVTNNGSDENKPLSKYIQQPADGEQPINTYASFLVKPNGEIPPVPSESTRPIFFHFGEYNDVATPDFTSLSTSFRGRVFIYPGNAANTVKFNLSFNANAPDAATETGDYSINEPVLLVVKYSSIAGADNDEVSLYIFKDGEDIGTEPAKPTIGPLKGTNRDAVLQSIALRQYQDGQNIIVDGILVKNKWELLEAASSTNAYRQNTKLTIAPNPATSGFINVELGTEHSFEVNVYDLLGKLILQQKILNKTLDISSLPKGIYLLQASKNELQATHKLVVY